MKAVQRIRAYLDAAARNYPGVLGISQVDGSKLEIADLEDVLASRSRYKQACREQQQRAETAERLAAALQQQITAAFHAVFPGWAPQISHASQLHKISEQVRMERDAVASAREQRSEATAELSRLRDSQVQEEAKYNDLLDAVRSFLATAPGAQGLSGNYADRLRACTPPPAPARPAPPGAETARLQAERDGILHVLYGPAADRAALYTNSEILQEIRRLQVRAEAERTQNRGFVKALDDTFGAIRQLYAELGGNPGVLPVNDGPRMLDWLSSQIKERERARARGVDISQNGAPDVVAVLQNALNRSSSRDEPLILSRSQAWQLLRRARQQPAQGGVAKIAEARAYQLRVHPDTSVREERRRELLASALALASGVSAIYPFGEQSWEGIRRRDGRAGQLAHAGACIAALIDLLPAPAQRVQENNPAAFTAGVRTHLRSTFPDAQDLA